LESIEEGTRGEGRAMRISPDASPEEVQKLKEMDRKRNQDLLDFMTIALNSDSENSFEEARKAVYGD
jgi:hypothetical protein